MLAVPHCEPSSIFSQLVSKEAKLQEGTTACSTDHVMSHLTATDSFDRLVAACVSKHGVKLRCRRVAFTDPACGGTADGGNVQLVESLPGHHGNTPPEQVAGQAREDCDGSASDVWVEPPGCPANQPKGWSQSQNLRQDHTMSMRLWWEGAGSIDK